MTIIEPNDVFEFVGCADDQRTEHFNMVSKLIIENEKEMIRVLGRQIEPVRMNALALLEGKHFEYSNDFQRLLLKGEWADTYSITALTEEGTALTESTSYDDGGSWIFDKQRSIIEKTSGSWSTSKFAITITGNYGYVEEWGETREDLKLILKQMVAMLSGLWKKTFISEAGDMQVQKDTPNKWLINQLRGHRNTQLL